MSKTRSETITFPNVNLVFPEIPPKNFNLTLGNVIVLECVSDISKSQVSLGETLYFAKSKTRSKTVTFPKVQLMHFLKFHPKHKFDIGKRNCFGTRFRRLKNQVSLWKTWYFAKSETRSKAVTFPKVKSMLLGGTSESINLTFGNVIVLECVFDFAKYQVFLRGILTF